jgi:hypothetical protein
MASILSDAFITNLTKRIRGIYDALNTLRENQIKQNVKILELTKRIERLELALYNIGQAFENGKSGKA